MFPALADVAELADAHGSGPCFSNEVGVQVPSSADDGVSLNTPKGGSSFAPSEAVITYNPNTHDALGVTHNG